MDKSIEAQGGRAAYEKLHSIVITGTMEVKSVGIKGSLTSYHAAPDKMLVEVEIQGLGTIRDGSDGKIAWEVSAMQGPRLKEGDEKAIALREGDFNSSLHWRDHYKTAVTEGIVKVDGKDCYKIVLTPNEGSPETQYIDKETNLPVKTEMVLKGPMGEIPVEATLGDYRKEGDILLPHKTVQKAAGQEYTITFDSIKFNVDIPKDKFDLPDEIQALLKK
jgi:Outer membrane lipoprotein-sorting protein